MLGEPDKDLKGTAFSKKVLSSRGKRSAKYELTVFTAAPTVFTAELTVFTAAFNVHCRTDGAHCSTHGVHCSIDGALPVGERRALLRKTL